MLARCAAAEGACLDLGKSNNQPRSPDHVHCPEDNHRPPAASGAQRYAGESKPVDREGDAGSASQGDGEQRSRSRREQRNGRELARPERARSGRDR